MKQITLDAGQEEQFRILTDALDKSPYQPEALNCLAALYQTKQEWDRAIECLKMSLACDPYNILTHLGIAQSSAVAGYDDQAIFHFNRAVEIDPHCPIAHVERGYFLRVRGFAHPEAEENWRIGIDDHEWSRCLQSANYNRPTRTLKPMWDGRPISGKRLYIWHEQGYGDAIWAARDIARAKEISQATVIVEVPLCLYRLFANLEGADQVIVGRSVFGFPVPFDEHISIMSLMHVLKTSPREQSGKPYFVLPAGGNEEIRRQRDDLFVGFCWTGNSGQVNNRERSIPFELMRPLTQLPNVRPVSLLYNDPDDLIPPKLAGDFLDTARRIDGCDLVVTTCTSIAHLAGSMGKPTWLLLHKNAWWGWFKDIEHTPWYGSMLLFRQKTEGDWTDVIERVKQELYGHKFGQN
jgi:hypothetical protein